MTTSNKGSSESRGYTTSVIRKVKEQDASAPVIQLALLCIERDIPMAHVAEKLLVTRMTVHNWFVGKFAPRKSHLQQIVAIIDALQ